MAFDPDAYLAESSSKGFDPDAYLKETEGKSVSGFVKNVGRDVVDTVKGLGGLAEGLMTHPVDTGINLATKMPKAIVDEGKRLGVGELLTGHPINAGSKFLDAAYDKPLTTAFDVAPVVGAAGKALGIGGKVAKTGALVDDIARIGVEGADDAARAATAIPGAVDDVAKAAAPAAEGFRSAVKLRGKTYIGDPGDLHVDVVRRIAEAEGIPEGAAYDLINKIGDQGFTQGGKFLSREEAAAQSGVRGEAASMRAAGKLDPTPPGDVSRMAPQAPNPINLPDEAAQLLKGAPGDFDEFYHVTTTDRVPGIMKEGLKPGQAGALDSASGNPLGPVYITKDKAFAESYAKTLGRHLGEDKVKTLKLKVPRDVSSKFAPDPDAGKMEFMSHEPISADFIEKGAPQAPSQPPGSVPLGATFQETVQNLKNKAQKPLDDVTSFLENKYGKAAKTPGAVENFGQALEQKARGMRLKEIGGTPGQIRTLRDRFGEGVINDLADLAESKGITKGFFNFQTGNAIKDLSKTAGKNVGAIREIATSRGAVHNIEDLITKIRSELDPVYLSGSGSSQKATYMKALQDIRKSGADVHSIADTITQTNKFIKKNRLTQPLSATSDVMNTASRLNNELVRRFLKPAEADLYKEALKDFSASKVFDKMYGFTYGRDMAGRSGPASPINFIKDVGGRKIMEKVFSKVGKKMQQSPASMENPLSLGSDVLDAIDEALDEIIQQMGKGDIQQ